MSPGAVPRSPAGDDAVWAALVDRHAQDVWQLAVSAGLDVPAAAVVSQLLWLRLAERWPTVRGLAGDAGGAAQLDGWIRDTVGTQVRAWLDHNARRQRAGSLASPDVVRLAPGFAPPGDRRCACNPARPRRWWRTRLLVTGRPGTGSSRRTAG